MAVLDHKTLDAIFSEYGETATFASETRWRSVLENCDEREYAKRWLNANDAVFRAIHDAVWSMGIRDRHEFAEVMLLMYARHVHNR